MTNAEFNEDSVLWEQDSGTGLLESLKKLLFDVDDEDDLEEVDTKVWDPCLWTKDQNRIVTCRIGQGPLREIAFLKQNEILLGVTSSGIMYLKGGERGEHTDVYTTNGYVLKQHELLNVGPFRIKNAFTVNNTMAAHVRDRWDRSDKLLFWNAQKKQVYCYEATENLAITGCTGIPESDNETMPHTELLHMQGAKRPVRYITGKVKTQVVEQEIVLKRLPERLKTWNIPVLACCVMMALLCAALLQWGNIFDTDQQRGQFYYLTLMLRRMLSFMGCMVVLKPLFPMALAKIKWTKFYGVLGACAVGGICLVLANMIAVEFDVMRIRPDIELFLWIPFIAAYLLNKPRKAAFWNGAAVVMLASYTFGSFVTDNNLSTSYLLQLVIMAGAALIITELIRDKGRAWQMMVPIGLLAIVCVGIVVWYSGGISSMLSPEESWSAYWWSSLSQHCLEVLKHAKLFGPSEIARPIQMAFESAYPRDYVERYFINFLIQNYGIVTGVIAAMLPVALVSAMLIGARRQQCRLDRCICMSCSVYLLLELLISLPANFGLQLIPPFGISFMGVNAQMWYAGMLAVCVYMAFYRAHSHRR